MVIVHFVLALLAAAGYVSASCNADNCYRALLGSRQSGAGTVFCSSYMAPSFTGSIPTYASPCSSSAVRLSSACNCLMATGSVSATIANPTSTSTHTTSPTRSASTSTTLSTSTTTASTCRITRTHTVFTTIPVCSSTSTSVESDTATSTTTTTYTPIPTNVVYDPGFERGDYEWIYTNGNPQPDGPGTPAHSGSYSGQLSAIGPTLPDGSDAQDAAVQETYPSGQDPPGAYNGVELDYVLTAYVYVLSATSTDDTSPLCELTFSVGEQDVYSIQIDQNSVTNQYSPVYQAITVGNARDLTVALDLSCQLSSGDGLYSATVLVDDLYLFGTSVGCGGFQR